MQGLTFSFFLQIWKRSGDAINLVWSSLPTASCGCITISSKLLIQCKVPLRRVFFQFFSPPQAVLKQGVGRAGLQMTLECCAYFHSRMHQLPHQISLKQTGLLIGKAKSQAEGKGYVTNISVSTVKALHPCRERC